MEAGIHSTPLFDHLQGRQTTASLVSEAELIPQFVFLRTHSELCIAVSIYFDSFVSSPSMNVKNPGLLISAHWGGEEDSDEERVWAASWAPLEDTSMSRHSPEKPEHLSHLVLLLGWLLEVIVPESATTMKTLIQQPYQDPKVQEACDTINSIIPRCFFPAVLEYTQMMMKTFYIHTFRFSSSISSPLSGWSYRDIVLNFQIRYWPIGSNYFIFCESEPFTKSELSHPAEKRNDFFF